MHWDMYTILSVISGAILVLGALVLGSDAKERAYGLLGGVAFIAYGIYVAKQTSGRFTFPIAIFILPVGAIIWMLFNWYVNRQERLERSRQVESDAAVGVPSSFKPDPPQDN